MTKSNSDEDRYCERMDFPNTFNEFAEQYGFTDKEEHYTNGSQLIPVFRVKQWLNHIPNNSDEDCISREEVCDYISEFVNHEYATDRERELVKNIIGGIQHLPSIQPTTKENLVVGDCISRKALLEEIENGIKAGNYEEGYEEYPHINDMDDIIECVKYAESVQPTPKTDVLDKIRAEIEAEPYISKMEVLDIIDKYTAEETWEGIHAQVTAPKGTFDKIWNEAEDNDEI